MTDHAPNYRELVALFTDVDDLEEAISTLTGSGWDHAELSLLAQEGLLSTTHVVSPTDEIADDDHTHRQPPLGDTDVRQGRTLAVGMAGVAAAFLASGATIMTGGGALAALVGAAVAGGGAAAVAEAVGLHIGSRHDAFLQEQIDQGGILLWVKVDSDAGEMKARRILEESGGSHIHRHETASAAE